MRPSGSFVVLNRYTNNENVEVFRYSPMVFQCRHLREASLLLPLFFSLLNLYPHILTANQLFHQDPRLPTHGAPAYHPLITYLDLVAVYVLLFHLSSILHQGDEGTQIIGVLYVLTLRD